MTAFEFIRIVLLIKQPTLPNTEDSAPYVELCDGVEADSFRYRMIICNDTVAAILSAIIKSVVELLN